MLPHVPDLDAACCLKKGDVQKPVPPSEKALRRTLFPAHVNAFRSRRIRGEILLPQILQAILLELSVDRNQRIFAAVFRPVIAYESRLGPNHNMAFRAVTKDQHRTDRRFKLIMHRQALESIVPFQFFSRLPSVIGFRIRIDRARVKERFFYITPAARFGTRVGTFLRDRGRAA